VQHGPRGLYQVGGLRVLGYRIPLRLQQLKAGQAALPPGQRFARQLAGADAGS